MPNRPKPWLAALLAFFCQPIGLLYVGRWQWAAWSLAAATGLASLAFVYAGSLPWLQTILQLIFCSAIARVAYLQAVRFDAGRVRPSYSRWYGLVSAALAIILPLLGIRAFLYEPFRVPAGSMLPNFAIGTRLIAQKWGYGNYGAYGFGLMRTPVSAAVDRGDVFAFEYPPDRKVNYLKRIIGLPGDKVEYRNKTLFINGQQISQRPMKDYFDEPSTLYYSQFIEKLDKSEYAILLDKNRPDSIAPVRGFQYSENCTYANASVTCRVPQGHYYVLGDSRDNSLDSRFWGFVPQDHLIGKIVAAFP